MPAKEIACERDSAATHCWYLGEMRESGQLLRSMAKNEPVAARMLARVFCEMVGAHATGIDVVCGEGSFGNSAVWRRASNTAA